MGNVVSTADALFTYWCDGIVKMPTGPERLLSDSETESRRRGCDSASGESTARPTLSRRQALTGIGCLSLGTTAGCLDSVRNLGRSRVPVDAKAPAGWDDERGTIVEPEDDADEQPATAGEFYFLLEENEITVDELYKDTESNDLILFYESDAETPAESDEEIALIYHVFKEGLIARGLDVNYLYTEIVPESRFDGQTGGWAVNSQWAERHVAGEVDSLAVWNKIADTKVYDEDEGSQEEANATEASNESTTATDQDGTNDETEPDSESSARNESDETGDEE